MKRNQRVKSQFFALTQATVLKKWRYSLPPLRDSSVDPIKMCVHSIYEDGVQLKAISLTRKTGKHGNYWISLRADAGYFHGSPLKVIASADELEEMKLFIGDELWLQRRNCSSRYWQDQMVLYREPQDVLDMVMREALV